ncbi:hypothetical protein Bca4012_095255 [Brassica carinata]|uniref:Uncharacterized protein n=1 Tax=Brassica carinata TaxID=52824 RepID=A0A8X7PUK1_BRACI|nr:hypothetical protein Bca52824_077254 [Brassica carinata]
MEFSSAVGGVPPHEILHPTHPTHQEAINKAMDEVRDVMRQHTTCADPTESAARKERMRQAEELGEVEETAFQMVKESLAIPTEANRSELTQENRPEFMQF